jgi:hypothetical protein
MDSPTTTVVEPAALCHFVHGNGAGERAAAWVAAQQLELITVEQLRAAGVGRGIVHTRRRQGTLHRGHTRVHLMGTKVLLPGAVERVAALADLDRGFQDGIPITAPARPGAQERRL